MTKLETEQLKNLLSTVYEKGNTGSDFQEVMNILKNGIMEAAAGKQQAGEYHN